MKRIIPLTFLALFFFGCNINPNKEARIQQLESKVEQAILKTSQLEIKVQTLERVNERLKTRISELEKGENF